MDQLIDYVCERRGSPEVVRDAEAAWDVEKQEWVQHAIFDQAFCDGERTTLMAVPRILTQGSADDIHDWICDGHADNRRADELKIFIRVIAWRFSQLQEENNILCHRLQNP